MKTLCLYYDDFGEPKQCVVTHPDSVLVEQNIEQLKLLLLHFNPGGGLFVIPLHDGVAPLNDVPAVYDSIGDEIACEYRELA